MEPDFPRLMPGGSKAAHYAALLPRLSALIEGERDEVSVMANVAAALHASFPWLWTGFYRVAGPDWLALGPFQGNVACWRIRRGRGVCGTAWATGQTQVVPDVDRFPGHIACSSLSRSEIVVPLRDRQGRIRAVLDVDSDRPAAFDDVDRQWLERIGQLIAEAVYEIDQAFRDGLA